MCVCVCVEILISLVSLLFLFQCSIIVFLYHAFPQSVFLSSSGSPAARGSLVVVTHISVAEQRTKISVSAGRCLSAGFSPICF